MFSNNYIEEKIGDEDAVTPFHKKIGALKDLNNNELMPDVVVDECSPSGRESHDLKTNL